MSQTFYLESPDVVAKRVAHGDWSGPVQLGLMVARAIRERDAEWQKRVEHLEAEVARLCGFKTATEQHLKR